MKRCISLLLALIFLLCACNTHTPNDNASNSSSDTNNGDVPADSEYDDNADEMAKAYKDIVCRVPEMYSSQSFLCKDSHFLLRITFPSDWKFEKAQNGKTSIKRDGNEIGWVRSGKDIGLNGWKSVKHAEFKYSSMVTAYDIEYLTTSSEPKFRYRLTYTYNDVSDKQVINIAVDFAEICPKLRNKMLTEWSNTRISSEPNMNLLSDIDKSRAVAFIGNSFIWTSEVANIFSEMLTVNRKNLPVRTFEYGGAQIYNFARNQTLLSELRSGEYGTVFLCGFYGKYKNEDLQIIIDACKQGNAKLVAFPAHNETPSSIESAKAYAKDLTFLNWKDEIDMLITDGVNASDMYVNDAHNHSTPLAGYVGAHMVYRAIYGEVPKGTLSGVVSTSYAKSKLGDYTRLGYIYTRNIVEAIRLD